jgi:hypothetical protein
MGEKFFTRLVLAVENTEQNRDIFMLFFFKVGKAHLNIFNC